MYIREAILSDVNQVVHLVNEGYWSRQKAFFQESPESLRTNETEVQSLVASRDLYVLVNEVEQIVGTIFYDRTAVSFGLFTVSSDEKYRGQGLGERMITFIENKAREDRHTKIAIDVLSIAEKLITYYNKIGYQPTGESHDFTSVTKARLKEEYEPSAVRYIVLQKTLIDPL